MCTNIQVIDFPSITRATAENTRLINQRANRNSTYYFFTHRIINTWNSLPSHLCLSLQNVHNSLIPYYRHKLINHFDPNNTCTWVSSCGCGCCYWTPGNYSSTPLSTLSRTTRLNPTAQHNQVRNILHYTSSVQNCGKMHITYLDCKCSDWYGV